VKGSTGVGLRKGLRWRGRPAGLEYGAVVRGLAREGLRGLSRSGARGFCLKERLEEGVKGQGSPCWGLAKWSRCGANRRG